jgi:hypothetical protein
MRLTVTSAKPAYSARPVLQYYLTIGAELPRLLLLSLMLLLKVEKGGDGEHTCIYMIV